MKSKKKKMAIHKSLLRQLKRELQALLDSHYIGWGDIYEYDFKTEFKLPFGGHTAHKIYKGHYVGKKVLKDGLDHFNIPYQMNYGLIDKPKDNEEEKDNNSQAIPGDEQA